MSLTTPLPRKAAAKTKKRSEYYVDNAKFLEEIIKYKAEVARAAELRLNEVPRPNNYLGSCIYLIASGLSQKRNFVMYPHIDEMVGDGIENCVRALTKFDENKTQNPFAYFTQVVYYAFLRRIGLEKHHLAVKHRLTERTVIFGDHFEGGDGENHAVNTIDLDNSYMSENAQQLDEKKAIAKVKRQTKKKKAAETSLEELVAIAAAHRNGNTACS